MKLFSWFLSPPNATARTKSAVPAALALAVPPLAAFTPKERQLVRRLDTPAKVQAWLNRIPYNWERRGETARSFRGVVLHNTAHCLEAALFAATILEQHGHPPILLDIESRDELDHVLYLFRGRAGGAGGRWGAIGLSRDPGLYGRKPVFRNVRHLVQSYVAPYIDRTGRVEGYGVLDLRDLPTQRWRLGAGNVWAVEQALIDNHHTKMPTAPRTYKRWRKRFDAWWEKNGRPDHEWPTFVDYPYRRTWTWP